MKFSAHNPADVSKITTLFTDTFSDSEGADEGKVIGQLAESLLTTTIGDELYCFVAEEDEELLGAVIFTEFKDEAGTKAALLSPMAVATKHQGKKMGQKLIQFGLEALKQQGFTIAVTYGDPSFYSKVGFAQVTEAQVASPQPLSYPHGWIAQSLVGGDVQLIGKTQCAPALDKPDFW